MSYNFLNGKLMRRQHLKYTLHGTEPLYKGFFGMDRYTVSYEGFDGTIIGPMSREIFERGDAAALVPYDPVRDEVILIEQFRPGAIRKDQNPWLLEVVAGIVDEKDRHNTLNTVLREVREEAGVECSKAVFATRFFTTPGGSTESIDLYIGMVDASKACGIHGLATEHENIRVFSVPFSEAYEMLENGDFCNAIAIIGIQYLALHRENIRKNFLSE